MRMERNAGASNKAAATTTTDQRIGNDTHHAYLSGDFEPNRALSSNYPNIIIGFDQIGIVFLAQSLANLFARFRIAIIGHDIGAIGFGTFNFGR